jgi:hypothetical protein
MARYGATPLATDTWYYVAGIYDAEAQTLDVYLNGDLDTGFLLGSVTGSQRSSREAVYVGRSKFKGFEFAGAIDDVRIYSRALTQAEIAADMHGAGSNVVAIQHTTGKRIDSHGSAKGPRQLDTQCTGLSEVEDARIPGAAAVLGALVAVACVGFRPALGPMTYLFISFAAGLLLLPAMTSTLPLLCFWMMPLVSLAGGASVAVSVRRQKA